MHLITETLHSAPLPWRPVQLILSLQHSGTKLIKKTVLHDEQPTDHYTTTVFSPSSNCVPLCRTLLANDHPIYITSQWQNDCRLALVINSSLIDDLTIEKPAIRFATTLDRNKTLLDYQVLPDTKSGPCKLQQLTSVNMVNDNVSYRQQLPSVQWRAACSCFIRLTMPDHIWPINAYDKNNSHATVNLSIISTSLSINIASISAYLTELPPSPSVDLSVCVCVCLSW